MLYPNFTREVMIYYSHGFTHFMTSTVPYCTSTLEVDHKGLDAACCTATLSQRGIFNTPRASELTLAIREAAARCSMVVSEDEDNEMVF